MTENKAADTSSTQSEDSELSASEMEGVVGGRSSGSRNVRNNSQSDAAYHSEDDKRDG